MIVGGAIALLSWWTMPPRHRGPSQTFNVETGEIETHATDYEGRLNGQLGMVLSSLLILVGQLYHIDRD